MKYLNKPILGTQLNWSHSLNKGLVGFWLFNEGHGNKVNDLSMNGNTGTLTSMADPPTTVSGWNPGRTGNALSFGGDDDYVLGSDNPSLEFSADFSVGACITPARITGTQVIIQKDNWGEFATGMFLALNDDKVLFGTGLWSADVDQVTSLGSVVVNTSVCILGVRKNATYSIYINGSFDNSAEHVIRNTAGTDPFSIGGRYHLGDLAGYYNGSIDEVRIYNRALSASEIQQLYSEPYCMFL